MRRGLLALALIVVASSTHLAQQPASTGKPNFVGVWKNVLPATDSSGGILTVRISDDGGGAKERLFAYGISRVCRTVGRQVSDAGTDARGTCR